jgi:hypothetical protein
MGGDKEAKLAEKLEKMRLKASKDEEKQARRDEERRDKELKKRVRSVLSWVSLPCSSD